MDGSKPPVEIEEMKSLLSEVTDLKKETRATLQTDGWQWLLIWSAACLGFVLSAYGGFAEWYWVAAVPVAVVATALLQVKVEGNAPVRRKAWPYWAVGASMTVAGFGSSALFPATTSVIAVWIVFGLGFTAFALLERLPSAAVMFAVVTLVSAVVGFSADDPFGVAPALALLFSVSMAGMAVRLRAVSRR